VLAIHAGQIVMIVLMFTLPLPAVHLLCLGLLKKLEEVGLVQRAGRYAVPKGLSRLRRRRNGRAAAAAAAAAPVPAAAILADAAAWAPQSVLPKETHPTALPQAPAPQPSSSSSAGQQDALLVLADAAAAAEPQQSGVSKVQLQAQISSLQGQLQQLLAMLPLTAKLVAILLQRAGEMKEELKGLQEKVALLA